MKLTEVVLGASIEGRSRALAYRPLAEGTSVLLLPPPLLPEEAAAALRETLSRPERATARDRLPFVRVSAEAAGLELSIADDASGGGRMLTEAGPSGVALVLEVEAAQGEEAQDERREALLRRVCIAAGAESSALLEAALITGDTPRAPDPQAQAYVAAERRAQELAREVRAVDDRMTASVVPDWIWIATGLGGLGVLLTAVVLLYPELRVVLVPLVLVGSLLGFAAYARSSARELKVRGALLVERKELRARRETARAEAKALAEALQAAGREPAAALLAEAGGVREAVPRVCTAAEVTTQGRQVLLFAIDPPVGAPEERTLRAREI